MKMQINQMLCHGMFYSFWWILPILSWKWKPIKLDGMGWHVNQHISVTILRYMFNMSILQSKWHQCIPPCVSAKPDWDLYNLPQAVHTTAFFRSGGCVHTIQGRHFGRPSFVVWTTRPAQQSWFFHDKCLYLESCIVRNSQHLEI